MNNEKITIKQIQEMDKFSNDVYREILSDSPDIAIANTTMRKHTEPMKQELMNLVALKKMLDECVANYDTIKQDLKENYSHLKEKAKLNGKYAIELYEKGSVTL